MAVQDYNPVSYVTGNPADMTEKATSALSLSPVKGCPVYPC